MPYNLHEWNKVKQLFSLVINLPVIIFFISWLIVLSTVHYYYCEKICPSCPDSFKFLVLSVQQSKDQDLCFIYRYTKQRKTPQVCLSFWLLLFLHKHDQNRQPVAVRQFRSQSQWLSECEYQEMNSMIWWLLCRLN